MAGATWVVAFTDTIIRREARVAPDGSFRLDALPPGRYGLKTGHDAYEDPHVPRGDNLAIEARRAARDEFLVRELLRRPEHPDDGVAPVGARHPARVP